MATDSLCNEIIEQYVCNLVVTTAESFGLQGDSVLISFMDTIWYEMILDFAQYEATSSEQIRKAVYDEIKGFAEFDAEARNIVDDGSEDLDS